MKSAEIRSAFLNYFKRQNHAVIESSSLVPSNDPTLMFVNAGMVQFKDVFLGKDPRPYTRATTSQKCVRAGGKHNDLENVGFTARHHTFFEMLGNFSFGDYFKKEAIHFAWEFVTKELKLPKDKLYVTVFREDDEAAEIWNKQEGVPLDRIYRFDEKDNFWSMGDTGPCGPCTEIFIDRGVEHGGPECGKTKECKMGCDCDRFMEFWNLVFMQYDRSSDGVLTPLPKPSVDTGAGLERIASIMQNAETNYDTDGFQEIITAIAQVSKKSYSDESLKPSFRVIADHARATTFLIGDGVMPSNEGRGYVLRRIMRRAIRHGKKLGFTAPFFYQICRSVISQMKSAYPDLVEKQTFIEKAVQAEEEQFFRTLERGLSLLDEETAKLGSAKKLSGTVAFKLYDTYGFPLDLTRVILEEKGLSVDEAGFEKEMSVQREESRKSWKGTGDETVSKEAYELAARLKAENKLPVFLGYDHLEAEGECLAIWKSAKNPNVCEAVFTRTPFYAEGGGQSADRGIVKGAGFEAQVVDVQKPVPDLIVVSMTPATVPLKVGMRVNQITDLGIRSATARNHTATHLLHWALREVLGKHVKQAGSLVNEQLLRFDFSHFQPLTREELEKVESLINEKIWKGDAVSKKEMSKDDAVSNGAIAFFGEKYGDLVRVVSVGGFSTELCGGTHVDNSSDIHLFKIASEAGIAAGVRRIIAYTSKGAFDYLRKKDEAVRSLREKLKASSDEEVLPKVEKMIGDERELRKQIEKFQAKAVSGEIDSFLAQAFTIGETKIITGICENDGSGTKRLRDAADQIKNKNPNSVSVLGLSDTAAGKVFLAVGVGPQAPKTFAANAILQPLCGFIDGKGGGKPDFAQAGGTKLDGLNAAISEARKMNTSA